MGQTIDNFISQLKTTKFQTLKQKLVSLSDPTAADETSTPSLNNIVSQSLSIAPIPEKDE